MKSAFSPGEGSSAPGPGMPWTPISLTRWSGEYLRKKGVQEGRLDSEHLLAHVLGVQRLELYLQYDRPLQPPELQAFKSLLRRRAAREPLQYLLGRTTFRDLELSTDPRALIPRPETEILVGEVLSWAQREASSLFRDGHAHSPSGEAPSGGVLPLLAVDVGTGTGAIALSLLKEGSFRRVVATDVSPNALALAWENALALGLSGGLETREGSLFEPLEEGEQFHVIVSNPPYVPEADGPNLPPEIRDWEPMRALLAGEEGMDLLSPLCNQAAAFLFPGGLLALEVGDGQAKQVTGLLERTEGFRDIRIVRDLAGRQRIVAANKK